MRADRRPQSRRDLRRHRHLPEDYGNEDLNGKEAVFETTLNYIEGHRHPRVERRVGLPRTLAATMSLNNVDELKAFVKSTMLYDNQASDVYTALHDKVSYADELPQTALDYYRDVLLYRILHLRPELRHRHGHAAVLRYDGCYL